MCSTLITHIHLSFRHISNRLRPFLFMSNEHNYLRESRKRTDISQYDIGFLLNLPDYSNVCRWEQGQRKPTVDMILLYHLLFDVPVETLFEHQKDSMKEDLIVRLDLLIMELRQVKPTPKVNSRIAFLTSALARLSA